MKKPVSKLSVLFILSILIPALVLAYLSARNIMDLRDISEKRMLESQEALAGRLQTEFGELLAGCTRQFFEAAEHGGTPAGLLALRDTLSWVEHAFLIGSDGVWMLPRYQPDTPVRNPVSFSNTFLNLYQRAEKAEFAFSDFSFAAQNYASARRLAGNRNEAAAALNGLSRALFKAGRHMESVSGYAELSSLYGNESDETGTPFAYYAAHQLMKLVEIRHCEEEAGKALQSVFTGFLTGRYALTETTGLLLDQFEQRHEQADTAAALPDLLFETAVRLRHVLDFVRTQGEAIAGAAIGNGGQAWLDHSVALSGLHERQPYLILLEPAAHTNVAGFAFDLEELKTRFLASAAPAAHSADCLVSIKNAASAQTQNRDRLHTVKPLHPLITSWRLIIAAKDPDALNRSIFRQKWMYAAAIASLMAGMALGIRLILRDLAREQKLATLRSDFVSNVTHELKTPLTSIRMYAETMLLGRVKAPAARKEYLTVIVHEAERLTRLINTVLDFSKIEQNEKQYVLTDLNLSEVVRHGLSAMDFCLKEQGFTLTTDIEAEIHLRGDSDGLEQALLNLISNSMKYSEDEKAISVRLRRADGFARLDVEDRGLGIPKERQAAVFDKYYRAHQDAGIHKEGSGLGLTVVRHIVEAHGGHIELESRVGQGSIFTIVLPL